LPESIIILKKILDMPEDKNPKKDNTIKELINDGAEIAGGAVSGALGFFAGGPLGAAVFGAGGSVAAKALKYIGQEVSERLLSPREKVRIGGVLAIAAAEINRRLEKKEHIRLDGFFENKKTNRSDAEEVTESILLKIQRETEEKKFLTWGTCWQTLLSML
jgi:hypothetical protein